MPISSASANFSYCGWTVVDRISLWRLCDFISYLKTRRMEGGTRTERYVYSKKLSKRTRSKLMRNFDKKFWSNEMRTHERRFNEVLNDFHLVTQQVTQTSFYLSWHSVSKKGRTTFVSTCTTKWKAAKHSLAWSLAWFLFEEIFSKSFIFLTNIAQPSFS